jgi:hypothetical protein
MLDEMVDIPTLLHKGGLVASRYAGQMAVAHGQVCVERWCIGVPEVTLPRWVLRGVTISIGERSMRISECGYRIQRRSIPTLA